MLVRTGRLLDVQERISQGAPLGPPNRHTKHLLRIAVETGFHSMVEVLAKATTDSSALDEALRVAIDKKRTDLAWLLIDCGADPKSVELELVAMSCDKSLLNFYFDRWDTLGNDRGLFEIILAMPYPLTGLIREFAPRVSNHKIQLGAALNHFIVNGNPKWAGLSVWMGADPRLPAPGPYDDWEEPEYWETPVQHAVSDGRLDVLKLIKVSKHKDDLNQLLGKVRFSQPRGEEVANYLLGLGAEINNKPNGGSSILDYLLRADTMARILNRYHGISVHAIERWITRGAKFVPDGPADLRETRAAVREISQWDVSRFMKVLAKGTTEEVFYQILNVPQMRTHLNCTSSGLRKLVSELYARLERRKQGANRFAPDPKQTRFKQLKPRFVPLKHTSRTRTELYDMLWSTPTTQIAEQCGMTDVALGKICKAYNIPKPSLGHWAKKAAGRRTTTKSLPDPTWNPEIEIRSYMGAPEIVNPDLSGKLASLIRNFSEQELQVEISSGGGHVHPTLTTEVMESVTERILSRRIARDGFETATSSSEHELENERMAERAIRVLNALLFFLESAGFETKVDEDSYRRHHFIARIFGNEASFALKREDSRLSLWIYRGPRTMRTTWTDGTKYSIEMYFSQFACSLAYVAALNGVPNDDD